MNSVINLGSANPSKLAAVRETLPNFTINSVKVSSGVSDQPLSLQETVKGAKNRARSSFSDCVYSIGIEDGIMELEGSYYNVCVCAVYDGKLFKLGFSSLFEYPSNVIRFVLEDGMDITQAFVAAKLSDDGNLGEGVGAIGVLSKGKILRKDYAKESVRMACLAFGLDFL